MDNLLEKARKNPRDPGNDMGNISNLFDDNDFKV